MIPMYATNCKRILGRIALRLVHTKEHNRAVHPGEKPDKERVGIKVVCTGLQIISTALCSVVLVKPRVIQMQLNQWGNGMPRKILRLPIVLDRTGLSRSTVYQRVTEGRFPRPVSLGARAVGWIEAEVEEWIAGQIEASRELCGQRAGVSRSSAR